MEALLRPLIWFVAGSAAIAAVSAVLVWWMEPSRRAIRAMTKLLGGRCDFAATAPLRGQGVAVSILPEGIAVVRRSGDRGMAFGFAELVGAELILDGEVRARAFIGESRRPLDSPRLKAQQVSVRLVFDDLRRPEFEIQMLEPQDVTVNPEEELAAARRLFAHLEAILRRAGSAPARPAAPPAPPAFDDDDD